MTIHGERHLYEYIAGVSNIFRGTLNTRRHRGTDRRWTVLILGDADTALRVYTVSWLQLRGLLSCAVGLCLVGFFSGWYLGVPSHGDTLGVRPALAKTSTPRAGLTKESVESGEPPDQKEKNQESVFLKINATAAESGAIDENTFDEGTSNCSGIRTADRSGFDKKVALTFDDGPNPETTPQVLDILQRHRVPATFFIRGDRIEEYETSLNILRRISENSLFSIGNHGQSHLDMSSLDDDTLALEVDRTTEIIKQAGGEPRFFRFPGGKASCEAYRFVRSRNYTVVGWNVHSADYCYNRGGGTCHIAHHRHVPLRMRHDMGRFISWQLNKTGGGIVLFHDTLPYTVKNLETIIVSLKEEGYTFTSLEDPETFPRQNQTQEARFAESLGLGNLDSALKLYAGDVETRWIEAAGGNNLAGTLLFPLAKGGSIEERLFEGPARREQGFTIQADSGTEVHAAESGFVGYAGNEIQGLGNIILLIHSGGWVTMYGHNQTNHVNVGQAVNRGDTIASVGDTGITREPGLYFALGFNGMVCDPLPLLRRADGEDSSAWLAEVGVDARSWTSSDNQPVRCRRRWSHPQLIRSRRTDSAETNNSRDTLPTQSETELEGGK